MLPSEWNDPQSGRDDTKEFRERQNDQARLRSLEAALAAERAAHAETKDRLHQLQGAWKAERITAETLEGREFDAVIELEQQAALAAKLREALAVTQEECRIRQKWLDEYHQEGHYTDENQTTWTRPTAFAYAAVCKARDQHAALAEALRKALLFAHTTMYTLQMEYCHVREIQPRLTEERALIAEVLRGTK